jgi:hypothetical protein
MGDSVKTLFLYTLSHEFSTFITQALLKIQNQGPQPGQKRSLPGVNEHFAAGA